MNKFENLRLAGCKCDGVVNDLDPFVVMDDRHTIIHVLLGEYDELICAGFYIHTDGFDRKVFPNPENGRYQSERDAKIYILALIIDSYSNLLPPEIIAIVRLARDQCRQMEMF